VQRLAVVFVVLICLAVSAVVFGYSAAPASAHRAYCHMKHSCPSDHATYRWGAKNLLCVAPTASERNASFKLRVVYNGRLHYCKR
jgi:hypothetical protein